MLVLLSACASVGSFVANVDQASPTLEDFPCNPSHVGDLGVRLHVSNGLTCSTVYWERHGKFELFRHPDGLFSVCAADGASAYHGLSVEQVGALDLALGVAAARIAVPECGDDDQAAVTIGAAP